MAGLIAWCNLVSLPLVGAPLAVLLLILSLFRAFGTRRLRRSTLPTTMGLGSVAAAMRTLCWVEGCAGVAAVGSLAAASTGLLKSAPLWLYLAWFSLLSLQSLLGLECARRAARWLDAGIVAIVARGAQALLAIGTIVVGAVLASGNPRYLLLGLALGVVPALAGVCLGADALRRVASYLPQMEELRRPVTPIPD